jgi:hypothetical protein
MAQKSIVNKVILWCYNYSRPEDFIAEIEPRGSVMYAHYLNKWTAIAHRYSGADVFCRFYLELDIEHREKFDKFLTEKYKG